MKVVNAPVITLDGPSGSGKGTVGQRVALKLGWHYLDSGAVYRALALAAAKAGVSETDIAAFSELGRNLNVVCTPQYDDTAVIEIDGVPADAKLRSEECGERASKMAAIPEIRAILLELQRRARRAPGLVADGRDMGTVVFPDAGLKVFLTASARERAQRRYNQLKEKGFDANLRHLFQAIQERDARDSERATSPLKPAEDAITLDTTDLSINQVVAHILDLTQTKLAVARANEGER